MSSSESKFRRSSWLLTILMVSIALVHIVFVYFPGRKALAKLRKEIQYRQQFINKADDIVEKLSAAEHELSEVNAYVDRWRQKSASTDRLPALYGKIQELSNQAGTTTTRFEPQIIIQYDTIRQIPIHIACTGTFAQIYNFVRSIEELPLTIWVDSLQLNKDIKYGQYISGEIIIDVFSDNLNISNYIDFVK